MSEYVPDVTASAVLSGIFVKSGFGKFALFCKYVRVVLIKLKDAFVHIEQNNFWNELKKRIQMVINQDSFDYFHKNSNYVKTFLDFFE